MSRPDHVTIFGEAWELVWSDDSIIFSNDESVGFTDLVRRRLHVYCGERPEAAVKRIACHEIGHAIVNAYGIVVPPHLDADNREEAFVAQWAGAWHQVTVDNPEFIDWLYE